MIDAVIVAAVRAPVGKRGGGLSTIHPADLGAHVLEQLIVRTGIDPAMVDDVIWGCVSQIGEQSFDIARTSLLSAGWPEHVPGTTVDRQCGSSQQALHFAAAGIVSGQYDVAVAGGVEAMSRIPIGSAFQGNEPLGERYQQRYGPEFPSQGIGAEMIADKWGLSRTDLDSYSLESHARAAAAQDAGLFDDEIAVIDVDGHTIAADEGVRRDSTMQKLGGLAPAFREDGRITAANSSQISDGAAALLMMSDGASKKHGLPPLARVHTAIVTGAAPMPMLTGPIPATHKVLAKSGLSLDEIGVFEVNEAFASVVLAWQQEFGVDWERVNPRGGAIALGHPLGGSGARLMATLVHHMSANGIRYGLQTMCEGGGQANATIIELIA